MKCSLFPAAVFAAAFALIPQMTRADFVSVISDTTWRAYNHLPPAGWNTDLAFNDSDAAGWENAVGNTSNNHIWYHSLHSADAPNNAWFRHIFTLTRPVTDASGVFHFDDNGQAYINGSLLIDDHGGGASNFNLALDPGIFVTGQNLVAVHGIDTIAPDNSIGVNLSIDVVPEPSSGACGAVGMAWLLARRQRGGCAVHYCRFGHHHPHCFHPRRWWNAHGVLHHLGRCHRPHRPHRPHRHHCRGRWHAVWRITPCTPSSWPRQHPQPPYNFRVRCTRAQVAELADALL